MYQSFQLLIKPALDLAHIMDIGNNPEMAALYDARSGCINVWCTPEDNPGGPWENVKMSAGAHCKPSEFVGTITWVWDDAANNIIALEIDSSAYHLADEMPKKFGNCSQAVAEMAGKTSIYNRTPDLEWVKQKAIELWKMANVPVTEYIPIRFKQVSNG